MFWDFSDLFNSLKGKTIKSIETEGNNSTYIIYFEDGDRIDFISGTHTKDGEVSSSIIVERQDETSNQ